MSPGNQRQPTTVYQSEIGGLTFFLHKCRNLSANFILLQTFIFLHSESHADLLFTPYWYHGACPWALDFLGAFLKSLSEEPFWRAFLKSHQAWYLNTQVFWLLCSCHLGGKNYDRSGRASALLLWAASWRCDQTAGNFIQPWNTGF